ncbi:MAG: hypothetical protein TREMPRED_005196 [Tremellales sp. Tagirdzhanova-0007]|nr:MAG: hypothetical protein TREMPRED_005196 [Tremellales sp. Tagirdzhanova-0007]
MNTSVAELPRHDYYQTPQQIILSIYVKGYGAAGIKEAVRLDIKVDRLTIHLPPLSSDPSTTSPTELILAPLYGTINPDGCSLRALSSKLELVLVKTESITWPSLLASSRTEQLAGPSVVPQPIASDGIAITKPDKRGAGRKNWDQVVDTELGDGKDGEGKDPNTGGDAALQSLFSSIYSNADSDTRRAMIKSFTESGGTTLSTDWSSIGKEKTPVRPPEGMEERDYGGSESAANLGPDTWYSTIGKRPTTPVVIWRDELRVYELTSQTLMFDFDKKYEDNLKLIHTHYGFEISLIGAPIRAAFDGPKAEDRSRARRGLIGGFADEGEFNVVVELAGPRATSASPMTPSPMNGSLKSSNLLPQPPSDVSSLSTVTVATSKPASYSNATQPLDVGIFGPLKRTPAKEVDCAAKYDVGRVAKADRAANLDLARARSAAMTKANIIVGWKATWAISKKGVQLADFEVPVRGRRRAVWSAYTPKDRAYERPINLCD